MPIRHRFQSAKADGADTTLVRPSNWNDEHSAPPFVYPLVGAAVNLTSLPAAISRSTIGRVRLDFTSVNEARFNMFVSTAGTSTSVSRISYSLDDGTNWAEFGALADVNMSLASAGFRITAWLPVPGAAKADVMLGWTREGGDGTASPQVTALSVSYR